MSQLLTGILLLLLVCGCTVRGSTCPSCPVFSQASYSSSVPENAAIGSSVLQISATDPNGDTLSFSIASGSGTTAFSIEASSGVMRVASKLDYETTASHTLYIVVTDGYSEVVAMVTITVLDVPELLYHVECDPMVLRVEVTEDTPAMTNTTQALVCLDPDHSDATFTFSFSSSGGESPISMDEMGFVLLAQDLDYELQTLHTVTVSFIDQNGNDAVGTATVVITVLPVNEYPPQFSAAMATTMSIAESAPPATSLGEVTATDDDNGLDGQVKYDVAGGNGSLYFTVHPSTGDLISIAPLDYELSTQYWLVVMATDSPTNSSMSLSANVTLVILVTDDNDNTPLFSKHIYRANVSEDAAGSVPVLQVECTDEDTGINQAVTYSILDGAVTQFSISESSGQIEVGTALDYETLQQYLFTVQCTDSGSPPLSSIAMVIIQLLGANEFTPTFATSSVVYSVPEDTLVGVELGQLVASDGDSGIAGDISFAVLHSDTYCPSHLIQIEARSGKLYLIGALDYESPLIPTHQLLCQVQAVDNQPVIRTGTIDVLVVITDTNDNSPLCDSSVITTSVAEDTAVLSSLVSFSCSDADSSPLSYTLAPDIGLFSIDTTSGSSVQLVLSEVLDYENETSHHISVLATDGVFTTAINIFIAVEEVNEHTPVFTQVDYHCSVSEMSTPGTPLLCAVTATDADYGTDGELHYAITDSSPAVGQYFTINSSSGVIILASTIDYEADPIEFNLTVLAVDHSLTSVRSSSATVIITLLDLNDNTPVMESLNVFTVSEVADIGSIVGVASCSDADSGSNGVVTYSILSTNIVLNNGTLYPASLLFSIDNSTGAIKTTATLDYEAVRVYQLLIECADLGSPQLTTGAVVIISVQPVNEFSPLFVFPPPGLSLVINPLVDAIGTTLITVSATDQDEGSDGIVTYSIELISPISESHVQILAVDSRSGALGVASLPSCTLGNELSYRITASDEGAPSLNTSTNMTLLVMQSCDLLPPNISVSFYAANIIETAQVNTSIVQITCTDPNLMSSLVIKYTITNLTENNMFGIDEDTGQVRVAASLDYEQAHQVLVNVRCYSSDDASLNADVSVYINILSVNEYDPVFDLMPSVIQVDEDTPPGAVIMTALATDADQGDDGRVTYALVTEGPFDIDMFTGKVYLIGILDRETNEEYLMEIVAHDSTLNAADRRASTVSVSVQVMDINDNYPQCPQQLYRVTIDQDTVPGTPLVELNCTDLDKDSKLTYSMIGSQQMMLLTVNETTGVLSLIGTVSNAPRQQTLAVSVTDSGTASSLSITVHVFITVELLTEYVSLNQTAEDVLIAESQQNTVSVTIDRVDSNSWSSAVEEALKMTLAQAATGQCALDPSSCSILPTCTSTEERTKRQTEPLRYISFSQSDVVIDIDRVSANSLILTTYIRLPVGTPRDLSPDTDHVIPRATLEQIVANNEATIGAVVRDHLPQHQAVSSMANSWMYIAITMVAVFVVLIIIAFVIIIIPRLHRKLSLSISSSKVAPSSLKHQESTAPSSRQASSCDGCSLIDVSPPSSAAAAEQWSRKNTLFKLRSPQPAHPFGINDDDDIELIKT